MPSPGTVTSDECYVTSANQGAAVSKPPAWYRGNWFCRHLNCGEAAQLAKAFGVTFPFVLVGKAAPSPTEESKRRLPMWHRLLADGLPVWSKTRPAAAGRQWRARTHRPAANATLLKSGLELLWSLVLGVWSLLGGRGAEAPPTLKPSIAGSPRRLVHDSFFRGLSFQGFSNLGIEGVTFAFSSETFVFGCDVIFPLL